MSSPKVTPFQIGNSSGAVYDFAEVGDTLEKHGPHTEANSHTIIVIGAITLQTWMADGSVEAVDYDDKAFLDTPVGATHAVIARKAGTRTIHHNKA